MDTTMTVSPIDSSTMLAVSPLDTHHSHGSPPSPLTWTTPVLPPRATRRSATVPTPLPPLSFAKVSVLSAPSSAAPTDSEATGYEWPGAELSRSPSLLTSLIQSQSRLSSRNVSPSASAATSPGTTLLSPLATFPRTRPILRRSSTTSTSDEAEFVHGARKLSGPLDAVLESACEATSPEAMVAKVSTPPLQRRRSCLKFAVTPRPLQLGMPSSSACSSKRTSPRAEPIRQLPVVEDSDEDELDELDDEVATPGWHSDSDGYKEDSEDGFTSDEDAGVLGLAGPSRRFRPWVPWTAREPAPILATPRRRQAALVEPSTDDCGPVAPAPRRARVQIRDDDDERPSRHERKSKGRCSRHRSPPPAHRGAVLAAAPPPAARSPSAFDLCRRRKGEAREPSVRLSHVLQTASRGWRSDDGTTTPQAEAPLGVVPPVRRGMRLSRNCSAPAVVKFCPPAADANRATLALSAGESAPPRVDEVHVLAETSANATERSCPRRGLRRVLGAVKGERRSS